MPDPPSAVASGKLDHALTGVPWTVYWLGFAAIDELTYGGQQFGPLQMCSWGFDFDQFIDRFGLSSACGKLVNAADLHALQNAIGGLKDAVRGK
jgi:hypothetical protein